MGKQKDVPESAQEKAFAEVAKAKMADYRRRWLPLQRKLGEGVAAMGKADSQERRQAAGKASTDNAVQFSKAKDFVESRLTDSGAGVGSAKFNLAATGLGADEAQQRGLGFVAADQAIDDAYLQGLGMITAMGRGESAGALRGMGEVAQMSGRQAAQDAELAAQHRAGNAQLAGQVAGFGLSGGFKGVGDRMQSAFSQTGLGSSGFGTGMAYGNQDLGLFI